MNATAQLTANFSVSNTQGCSPLTVQFNDNSSGNPKEWFWSFGNGLTSTAQNPSITYTGSGNYTVRLIVKNSTQEDYVEKTNFIKVFATPQAGFINSIDSGCLSLPVSFDDTTSSAGFSIKSWLWDFGDGGTSSQQNPNHTYNTEGRFDVSLIVQTTDGCSNTFKKTAAISAGSKPDADFTASPLNGCASVLRQFKNNSSPKLTSSVWYFGDRNIGDREEPLYHYQDTGWFTVKLVASRYGCLDSLERVNYIHVTGPVAKIAKTVNCDDRFTITFKDISIGGATRLWNFDDGNTSALKSDVHVYAAPGQYLVKLRITENSCSDVITEPVTIAATKPLISALPQKSFYCRGDSIRFIFSNFDTAYASSFAWNFDNGDTLAYKSKNDTATYVYANNGRFKPIGFFKDDDRCIDTISFSGNISIVGPQAEFESPQQNCTDADVVFKDRSSANASAINLWSWAYGDGVFATDTNPFTYRYSFPGRYKALLTVKDANGCTDTISHTVEIYKTPIVKAANDTLICGGSNVILKAFGANDYTWQRNGNTICSNCFEPQVTPNTAGVYYVTGNTNGCTASDSVFIQVQTKQEVFVQPADVSVCTNDSVRLNAVGADKYKWAPDTTLGNENIFNPFVHPSGTRVYTVVGRDNNNCFTDTAIATVTIRKPPAVNIPNSNVMLPAGSDYLLQSIVSADVQTWQWSPPQGLTCYYCTTPVAAITGNITYVLTVSNSTGCSSSDSIRISSICTSDMVFVPNTFSPNNDGMNDYFFPNSKTSLMIKSMLIFNRWGQKVYENTNFPANDSGSGWNGKFNGKEQKEDVYVYIMQMVCSSGQSAVRKGSISLVR